MITILLILKNVQEKHLYCNYFNFFQVDKNNYSNFIEVFVGIDFLQDL
jgi:hypothetical protein